MFEWEFFHQVVDLLTFLNWTMHLLGQLLFALFSPLLFIINFLQSLLANMFKSPIASNFTMFGKELFPAIPMFSEITGILTACLILYIVFNAIKHLTRI